MNSDKVLKVTIVALVILLIGAVLGIKSTIEVPWEHEYIEIDDDDLMVFDGEVVSYSYNRFTFDQFTIKTGVEISEIDDILNYGIDNDYSIEQEESMVHLYKELGCKEDETGVTVCYIETIFFEIEEDLVEYQLEGFLEHE